MTFDELTAALEPYGFDCFTRGSWWRGLLHVESTFDGKVTAYPPMRDPRVMTREECVEWARETFSKEVARVD